MKIYFGGLILVLFGLCNINAQTNSNNFTDSCNCPPQYTHSEILKGNIKIEKIVVLDSAKYSVLPSIKDNLDSLTGLIIYPEIAKRADVFGEVIYLLKINEEGRVKEIKVKRRLGAGLDEAPLDILKSINFNPARINNKAAESQVYVSVNYKIDKFIDKPEYEFDEINYELYANLPYYRTIINFSKDGSACLIEDKGYKNEESIGRINPYFYSKLSDFIISQCFHNFKEIYYHSTSDIPKTTITLKFNNKIRTVSAYGDEHTPIGWWAIKNLIVHIKEQIKWEIIKSESTIKKLPQRDED